jgi:hypothetical protein
MRLSGLMGKRFVVVIGMARSGTSCTAGVIHHLGINMLSGDDNPPDIYNPGGYFERRDFASRFFQPAMGISRQHWDRIADNQIPIEVDENGLTSWLENVTDNETTQGIKDPRLIHIAGPFFQALIRIGVKPEIILCTRNKQSVKASWGKFQNQVSKDSNQDTLFDNWQAALDDLLSNKPYLTVDYDALVFDPEPEIEKIANYLHVPVTDEAITFVSKSLDHHPDDTPRTKKKKAGAMYKINESGGFAFGGKSYQEHHVYDLAAEGWELADIKAAERSRLIVKESNNG